MTDFGEVYKRLNDAQREAVDYIDGPLLVIAGPGTGKTELLGARVANILQKTDTDPSTILCVTFTNKAAANMRERLVSLIGAEARNVHVRTFHSFAADIMSMYPDYFWNGARLTIAPDAVQLEIIESVLTELPLDNPLSLTFAGQLTAVKPVQEALKLTKEAGLTPNKLRAIIELNLAYIDQIEARLVEALSPMLSTKRLPTLLAAIDALPSQGIGDGLEPLRPLDAVLRESLKAAINQDEQSGKTTHASKWKAAWVQTIDSVKGMHAERKRNMWWLNLADVYASYRQELHRRGYYDYADMLVEVITQLEQHADLRASVQEQFLYVLIDEFQDTNAAQMRLSHLVADHYSSDGSPNIMAVGDDDQSIFKFNGAELNNMLSFQRSYPTAKLIVLRDNYRSSQAVLDTARQVIELAEDRLVTRESGLDKKLVAAHKRPSGGVIEHRRYPTREHQLSDIATELQTIRQAHPDTSIGVLARGHDSLIQLASLLEHVHIQVKYERSNNVLRDPAVQQVVTLSRIITAIQAGDEMGVSALIAQMLRHPMWQLDAEAVWRMVTQNHADGDWLQRLTLSSDAQLQALGHWLVWLAAQADSEPLGVVMEYLLGLRAGEHLTSPVAKYYASSEADGDYIRRLSAIKRLLSAINDFSSRQLKTLADFVRFVDLMEANGQILADETVFASQPGAIELYTVHKAKGLEFDTVFILDAVEKNWQPTSGGRKPPANLPLQPNGDIADDYVRLMYVALTRARSNIHVTSYQTDDSGASVLATPLVATAIPERNISASAKTAVPVLEASLHWPRLPISTERQYLEPQLSKFTLSATKLLSFLDIDKGGPAKFFETYMLGLPRIRTPNIALGNAVHAALELAQHAAKHDAFDAQNVLTWFEQALKAEQLPLAAFDQYNHYGQELLRNLFGPLDYELPKDSTPEQKIIAHLPNGITLYGKIDRVDLIGDNGIAIVDYKTGKPLDSFLTKDQHKAIKAWRHKTQLAFYTLQAKHSTSFRHASSIESSMIYLQAASPRDLIRSYKPNADELVRLHALIAKVWEHVMKLDFPDVSGYVKTAAGIRQFEEDLLDGKI